MADKKYFWLKLKKDFFKRHDIQIIEALPDGKEYVLFYLKLLCESIDHNGYMRFSEDVPYSVDMLATITDTDRKIASDAIDVFLEFGLLEILDDQTFYLKQVETMIGCETEWAKKKRQYRDTQRTEEGHSEDKKRTKKDNVRQEIDIEIEKEKDKEKDIKHAYGEFQNVLLTDKEYQKLLTDFPEAEEAIEFLSAYIAEKGYKSKSHYLAIRRWVIGAVKERKEKAAKSSKKPHLQMMKKDADLSDLEKKLLAN